MALKTNPNGSLRALPQFDPATGWFTRSVLAADNCICCQRFPEPFPSGWVDLEIDDQFTAAYLFHFGAWFTEPLPGIGGYYIPTAYAANGVYRAEARMYVPGNIEIPDPEFDPQKYTVWFLLQLGSAQTTHWIQISPDEFASWGEFQISVKFPIRLMAKITQYSRYHYTGAIWERGAGLGETVDLRNYTSAELHWLYWNANEPGEIQIQFFQPPNKTYSFSLQGDGPPIVCDASNCLLQHGNGFNAPCWVTADVWGNPPFEEQHVVKYYEPLGKLRGVAATVRGKTVTVYPHGPASDARNFGIYIEELQPAKHVRLDASIRNLGPSEPFREQPLLLIPRDGPMPSSTESLPVHTEWPAGNSTMCSSPGYWEGSGARWRINVSCWLDIMTGYPVLTQEHYDYIDGPYLGWRYSDSSLRRAGLSPDAWRVPIRLPAPAAKWDAIRIVYRPRKRREYFRFTDWEPRGKANTFDIGSGLHLRITDSGGIRRHYEQESGLNTSRYLYVTARASKPVNGTLIVQPDKRWSFSLSEETTAIVFDLCCPDNASGPDDTTNLIDVVQNRGGFGGWGWGASARTQVELQFSASGSFDVWCYEIGFITQNESGFAATAENIHYHDERFKLGTVEINNVETDLYGRRGIVFAPDGHIALDTLMGLTIADNGINVFHDKVYRVFSINEMVHQMSAQAANGLPVCTSLRPGSGGVTAGWDGKFLYYKAQDFFNNLVEGFHLTEQWERYSVDAYTLKAWYTVDRIELGVGVSANLQHERILGAGVHGLVITADSKPSHAVTVYIADDRYQTEQNGIYCFPNISHLRLGSYYIEEDLHPLEGTPAVTDMRHGLTSRVCVKETHG